MNSETITPSPVFTPRPTGAERGNPLCAPVHRFTTRTRLAIVCYKWSRLYLEPFLQEPKINNPVQYEVRKHDGLQEQVSRIKTFAELRQ